MSIAEIAQQLEDALDKIEFPSITLPPELIWCTAIKRPGGSPMKTTSQIIQKLGLANFVTGPNTDGSPNMVNEFLYATVDGLYDMMTNDMVVDAATAPGTVNIETVVPGLGIFTGTNPIAFLTKGEMK